MNLKTSVMELYMQVKDADLLRRLLESKQMTARQLSRDMGWKSHSYLNRILSGEIRTVKPEAAVKLAYLLQVPVDLIFVPRVSGDTRRSAMQRSA